MICLVLNNLKIMESHLSELDIKNNDMNREIFTKGL